MRVGERTVLIAAAALLLLAPTAPVRADETPVPIRVGPATIAVPENWLTFAEMQPRYDDVLDLTPPLSQTDGFAGIDTTGVLTVNLQIRYDRFGNGDDWDVTGALARAREASGIARPEDAATAFESVPFDALYGDTVTNFGKSGITALYLLGSVSTKEHGTVVVGAVIPRSADATDRYYTIAFLLELDDQPYVARVTIKATRLFGPGDLGWIELAAAIANNRYDFAD